MKKIILSIIAILMMASSLADAGLWTKPKVCFQDDCFNVQIVSSAKDMERGLGGRKELKDGWGMLFIFSANGRHRFWMKDMKFSIDIVWINANKKVVMVEENVATCQTDPCPVYEPSEDAKYVLEVRSGQAKLHEIQIGSTCALKGMNE